jgi:hypothetical protein
MSEFALQWLVGEVRSSADVVCIVDEQEFRFRTTYVGDGLGSIIKSALDLKMGSSSAIATLPAEPQGVRLLFSDAGGSAYLQIVEFPDVWSESRWSGGRLRWSGRVDVGKYAREVLGMADSVIAAFGSIEAYERAWAPLGFPLDELSALRRRVDEGRH